MGFARECGPKAFGLVFELGTPSSLDSSLNASPEAGASPDTLLHLSKVLDLDSPATASQLPQQQQAEEKQTEETQTEQEQLEMDAPSEQSKLYRARLDDLVEEEHQRQQQLASEGLAPRSPGSPFVRLTNGFHAMMRVRPHPSPSSAPACS